MKLLRKLIIFLVVFSVIFYFIRSSSEYNIRVLLASNNGVTSLYAVIGTIFGLLAAFAIQKEWGKWDALIEAVRGEVDGLEKLYMWSNNFPTKIKAKVHTSIVHYLKFVAHEGWRQDVEGEKVSKSKRFW